MNLEIQNLSLSFFDKKVFENVNLEIFPGEILIVKGKNGSGKTSFLKTLAGFFSFDNKFFDNKEKNIYSQIEQNEILLNGKIFCSSIDVNENQSDYFYTRSFISADFEFFEEFDVKFYLNFWNKMNNVKKNENSQNFSNERFDSVVKYFNFEDFLEFEIQKLSSGWKKKLQYSKLMFENRVIWILDEPLNFLDDDGKNLILGMINAKIFSGGIVIASDHIGEIEKYLNFEAKQVKKIYL